MLAASQSRVAVSTSMPRSEGNATMPRRRRSSAVSGDCRLPNSVSPATARNAASRSCGDRQRRRLATPHSVMTWVTIVTIDHHRWQHEAGIGRDVEDVQPFDEAWRAVRLTRLHHLHDKLASAHAGTRLLPGTQPCWRVMAAPVRVGSHIRCATETRDSALRGRRAVALGVNLQRAADEQVARILSGDLGECTI